MPTAFPIGTTLISSAYALEKKHILKIKNRTIFLGILFKSITTSHKIKFAWNKSVYTEKHLEEMALNFAECVV